MPTYDYECKKCFHRFEKFQQITAKTLKECPKCHGQTLKRLIGAGGALIFRGSGFYITDYCRSKEPHNLNKENKRKEENKIKEQDKVKKSTSKS